MMASRERPVDGDNNQDIQRDNMLVHPLVHEQRSRDILQLLIGFRFINALCVATFFQPDEYFQSLEPAWQIVFGSQSGAWITWEWQHQLRSSLHPAIFAALYLVSNNLMEQLPLVPQFKATLLVVLPKILQALFAATGDFFTWKLAERIYGRDNNASWTALFLTIMSPWQWFCSTRTLSNSLEMVLTISGLHFWPWTLGEELIDQPPAEAMSAPAQSKSSSKQKAPPKTTLFDTAADLLSLRLCLVLAGTACILRPTNLLIWVSLLTTMTLRLGVNGIRQTNLRDIIIFFREAILCGGVVLSASVVSDRLYFGVWTFPPLQWLNFNITQSLAVFYGANDWHYYISQGLPLLLTTYLPFALISLWSSTSTSSSSISHFATTTRFDIAFMVLTMITTLSLISHKEVRFIYPLLPGLHVLAAPHIVSFFNAQPFPYAVTGTFSQVPHKIKSSRLALLILLLATNLAIGLYTTQVHQRGVIDVLAFLRHKYEEIYLAEERITIEGTSTNNSPSPRHPSTYPFAAFLMPCHSTPWRSHLVHPELHAWALTCEPPLRIPSGTPERAAYRDEADRFYDDPRGFLQREMNTSRRPWPRFVAGFEGIQTNLQDHCAAEMPGWEFVERWSGFNSHWHDDRRRHGNVVVWELVDVATPAVAGR